MILNQDFITRQELDIALKNTMIIIENLISKTQKTKRLLKGVEMQEYLGCSASTLRRMRIDGSLKPQKVGNTYYYNLNELL